MNIQFVRAIARRIYVSFRICRKRITTSILRSVLSRTQPHTFSHKGFRITEGPNDPNIVSKFCSDMGEFLLFKKSVEQFCKPAPVILDVGANVGIASLFFSRVRNSVVYAFEPMSATYALLRQNVEQNEIANIQTYALGLSNSNGVLTIGQRRSGDDSGSFGIIPDSDQRNTEGLVREVAQFVTLDEFVGEAGIDRLDYIKIDAEGWDTNVLKGGENTLRRFRPVIQIEISSGQFKHGAFDQKYLLRLADTFDCQIYVLYRRLRPMPDLASVLDQPGVALDVVLVPQPAANETTIQDHSNYRR